MQNAPSLSCGSVQAGAPTAAAARAAPPGTVSIVAPGGRLEPGLAALSRASAPGLRVALAVGRGFHDDAAGIVARLAQDERTRVIVVGTARPGRGRALVEAIRAAVPSKPVIAFISRTEAPMSRAETPEEPPLPPTDAAVAAGRPDSAAILTGALEQAGAVVLGDEEALVAAAAALSERRLPAIADAAGALLAAEAIGVPARPSSPFEIAKLRALVSDACAQLRARAAPPAAPAVQVAAVALHEEATKRLLERVGLRTPPRAVCNTPAEARAALATFGAPVHVKVLDVRAPAEAEAIARGLIASEAALAAAIAALDDLPGSDGPRRYLVEPSPGPGLDFIVRGFHHGRFGPTVTVGLAFGDDAALGVRLAPLAFEEALGMVDALERRGVVGGASGVEIDKRAVAEAIVAVGRLLADNTRTIAALTIAPLRAAASKALVLGARLIPQDHTGVHDGCC